MLDSQQLQLLEFEQDEFSSDVQDGVGMQQAEVSAATKQSSHLHSCLSSFAIVADDQQASPVTASSVNMIAGAVIEAVSMDMDVNDEQAAQAFADSAPQQSTVSQNSMKRKSGRNRRSNRGSKGSERIKFDSGCGDQRGEVKRSKNQL